MHSNHYFKCVLCTVDDGNMYDCKVPVYVHSYRI